MSLPGRRRRSSPLRARRIPGLSFPVFLHWVGVWGECLVLAAGPGGQTAQSSPTEAAPTPVGCWLGLSRLSSAGQSRGGMSDGI